MYKCKESLKNKFNKNLVEYFEERGVKVKPLTSHHRKQTLEYILENYGLGVIVNELIAYCKDEETLYNDSFMDPNHNPWANAIEVLKQVEKCF